MVSSLFSTAAVVAVTARIAFAADCFDASPKPIRGTWLEPSDLIKAMCNPGSNPNLDCNDQPGDDCMLIGTDTENGVDLLIRKQYVGDDGSPSFPNCEGSLNEIMSQCIDSGTSQRGLWQYGNERYHILYTYSVPEPTCSGMPGGLEYDLSGNPDFDWTIPSEVVQTVCGGMSARASSRDLNAGARWVVRGSKSGLAVEEDYTLCKQAMTKILHKCIIQQRHFGGIVVHDSKTYELKALQASRRMVVLQKGVSEGEFFDLVDKYNAKVQTSVAKRSNVDGEEPQYYQPELDFTVFQITGEDSLFDELKNERIVESIDWTRDSQSGMFAAVGRRGTSEEESVYGRSLAERGSPIQQFGDSPDHLKDLSSDGVSLNRNYTYDPVGGKGSVVYILDSGLFDEHDEFKNCDILQIKYDLDMDDGDDVGHGTQVASLVCGETLGVAKDAKVFMIRIWRKGARGAKLDDQIKGFQFARDHAEANGFNDRAVINFSMGGSGVDTKNALSKLIRGLNRIGIITVTAAGNDNKNACNNHPGSLGKSSTVINVGAVEVPSGKKAWFSNFGSCVSIWAPGDRIKTASLYQVSTGWDWWGWANNGYVIDSGTSFAAPIVSGLVAYQRSRVHDPNMRFEGASAAAYIDYFWATGKPVNTLGNDAPGRAPRRVNNMAGEDNCQTRLGSGHVCGDSRK